MNRFFCIEISGSCIVPGHHTETRLVRCLIHLIHVILIIHKILIHLLRIEQIRHAEDLIGLIKGL